jgi:hypothetical protein
MQIIEIWQHQRSSKKQYAMNEIGKMLFQVVNKSIEEQTLDKYTVTFIIGQLWVTAPRNWSHFDAVFSEAMQVHLWMVTVQN